MEERSIAQGVWAQHKVNCLRPVSASVQQLLARALREIPDGELGDAILEVSIYATEGALLVGVVARLLECIGELTIVAVIMLIFYTVLGGKGLKGAFGSNCFD